jgi:hypothetical protein
MRVAQLTVHLWHPAQIADFSPDENAGDGHSMQSGHYKFPALR